MSRKYIVITTINPPTEAIYKLARLKNWNIIVIADKKTTTDWSHTNIEYISVNEQEKSENALTKKLPWNSYTRKNIGYMVAIKKGADIIYDTDDDNIPLKNWVLEPIFSGIYETISNSEYLNVYSFFTNKALWPRGFPLDNILDKHSFSSNRKTKEIGVWQFLADGDPDVDAIYRLTSNRPIYFQKRRPLVLDFGTVCPFNSQNTYFRKEIFPLLYLPSTVSFRFTDILRGLIAQPIMWAADFCLGFGGPTVIQKRNDHDIFKDFELEIPVYLQVRKVIEISKNICKKNKSLIDNMVSVYLELEKEGIVAYKEIELLSMWLDEIAK